MALKEQSQSNSFQCLAYRVLTPGSRAPSYSYRSLCSISREMNGIKPSRAPSNTGFERHNFSRNSYKTVAETENFSPKSNTTNRQTQVNRSSSNFRLTENPAGYHDAKEVFWSQNMLSSKDSTSDCRTNATACKQPEICGDEPETLTRQKYTHHSSQSKCATAFLSRAVSNKTSSKTSKISIHAVDPKHFETDDLRCNVQTPHKGKFQEITKKKNSLIFYATQESSSEACTSQALKQYDIRKNFDLQLHAQSTTADDDDVSTNNLESSENVLQYSHSHSRAECTKSHTASFDYHSNQYATNDRPCTTTLKTFLPKVTKHSVLENSKEDANQKTKRNNNLILSSSISRTSAIPNNTVYKTPESKLCESASHAKASGTTTQRVSLPSSYWVNEMEKACYFTGIRNYDPKLNSKDAAVLNRNVTKAISIQQIHKNINQKQDLQEHLVTKENQKSMLYQDSNKTKNQSLTQNAYQNETNCFQDFKIYQNTNVQNSVIDNFAYVFSQNLADGSTNVTSKHKQSPRQSIFHKNSQSKACLEEVLQKKKPIFINERLNANAENNQCNNQRLLECHKAERCQEKLNYTLDSDKNKAAVLYSPEKSIQEHSIKNSKDFNEYKNLQVFTRSIDERLVSNISTNSKVLDKPRQLVTRKTHREKVSASNQLSLKPIKANVNETAISKNKTISVSYKKDSCMLETLQQKAIPKNVSERFSNRSSSLKKKNLFSNLQKPSRLDLLDQNFSRSETEELFQHSSKTSYAHVDMRRKQTRACRETSAEAAARAGSCTRSDKYSSIDDQVWSLITTDLMKRDFESKLSHSKNARSNKKSFSPKYEENCVLRINKPFTKVDKKLCLKRSTYDCFSQDEKNTPLNAYQEEKKRNKRVDNFNLSSFSQMKSFTSRKDEIFRFDPSPLKDDSEFPEIWQYNFLNAYKTVSLESLQNTSKLRSSQLTANSKSDLAAQSMHQQLMLEEPSSKKLQKIQNSDGTARKRANSMKLCHLIRLDDAIDLPRETDAVNTFSEDHTPSLHSQYYNRNRSSKQENPCYIFYSSNQSNSYQQHNKLKLLQPASSKLSYRRISRSLSRELSTTSKLEFKTSVDSKRKFCNENKNNQAVSIDILTKRQETPQNVTVATSDAVMSPSKRSLQNVRIRDISHVSFTKQEISGKNLSVCKSMFLPPNNVNANSEIYSSKTSTIEKSEKLRKSSRQIPQHNFTSQGTPVMHQSKSTKNNLEVTGNSTKATNDLPVTFVDKTLFPNDRTGVRYHIFHILQQAMFGAVYVASEEKHMKTTNTQWEHQRLVAIKMVARQLVSKHKGETPEDIQAEIKFYEAMRGHKNVISYDLFWEEDDKIFMVMPWAELGDLFDALSKRSEPLSEPQARWLFKQILEGAYFLHQKNIAFRDHSLENVLLFYDSSTDSPSNKTLKDPVVLAKITDPGQAIYFNIDPNTNIVEKKTSATVFGKSFRPPEVYLKRPYDPTKVDSFCLGWMLYFILTKKQAFNRAIFSDFNWSLLCQGQHVQFFDKTNTSFLSAAVRSLLCKMLDPDPNSRYSLEECLHHKWFQEVNEPVTVSCFLENDDHEE